MARAIRCQRTYRRSPFARTLSFPFVTRHASLLFLGGSRVTNLFLKNYAGKRVLVTGHTGFKGSWLAEWLLLLDARVHGISLAPNSSPSLFNVLNLPARLQHEVADIRDFETLKRTFERFQPQ